MKQLWVILLALAAFSCGDARQSANDESNESTEERLEEGSGENISPQLVPDDSLEGSRHDIDTVSSATGVERQSQQDSVD